MSLARVGVDPSRWDELALADERTQFTWNALDPIINRAANALSTLEYSERRIAVFATNSAETVIAYVACLEVGVSSVPVSYHLTSVEVTYILRDSGAVALFVGHFNRGEMIAHGYARNAHLDRKSTRLNS